MTLKKNFTPRKPHPGTLLGDLFDNSLPNNIADKVTDQGYRPYLNIYEQIRENRRWLADNWKDQSSILKEFSRKETLGYNQFIIFRLATLLEFFLAGQVTTKTTHRIINTWSECSNWVPLNVDHEASNLKLMLYYLNRLNHQPKFLTSGIICGQNVLLSNAYQASKTYLRLSRIPSGILHSLKLRTKYHYLHPEQWYINIDREFFSSTLDHRVDTPGVLKIIPSDDQFLVLELNDRSFSAYQHLGCNKSVKYRSDFPNIFLTYSYNPRTRKFHSLPIPILERKIGSLNLDSIIFIVLQSDMEIFEDNFRIKHPTMRIHTVDPQKMGLEQLYSDLAAKFNS